MGDSGWLAFLEGGNPGYPEAALRGEFATIRRKVEAMRLDTTTPDTRLADDPMAFNPATVGALVQLMLGGLPPKHQGEIKTPVSSMLALGVSNPHHHKGNRHGRPSYVFVLFAAI